MNIPTFSQNSDPSLRKLDRFIEWFLLTLILCVTLLVCCSCGSTKVVTQTVRDVSVDTVYLSNVQYDSIYIFHERTSDYHMNPLNPLKPSEPDTVFIKDVSVEYRYKLLRDTIYIRLGWTPSPSSAKWKSSGRSATSHGMQNSSAG